MRKVLTFTAKRPTMTLLKLAATTAFCITTLLSISSCEKESDERRSNLYIRNDISFTGSQIKPTASPSTGTGKMDIWYDKRDRVLNYVINWNGLSDSIIAIRVSGPAPVGFNTVNPAFAPAPATFASYATTPYVSLQTTLGTAPKALYPPTGRLAGSFFVDGVKVKEEDVLAGKYYITLHTKTILPIAAPGSYLYRWFGEVRAQMSFE